MTYADLEQLAVKVERLGGYGHVTGADGDFFEVIDGEDTIQIGPGRDTITFLQIMLRRSQSREAELKGVAEYDGTALAQQLRDGRLEVVAAVRETLARFSQ